MSFVHQRSSGGTHVRSPGGAKNMPSVYSYYQIVWGAVPVCGFGTFAAGSTFNPLLCMFGGQPGLVFNDVWPNVFLTLSESLVSVTVTQPQSGPGGGAGGTSTNTSTRVATYAQTWDRFLTVSIDDPNGFWNSGDNPGNGRTLVGSTVSATGSLFTIVWEMPLLNSSGVQYGTNTVTYTAEVSNQLNAATAWASWAAQSAALVADYPFPSFTDISAYQPYPGAFPTHGPGASGGWMMMPTVSSPGYTEALGFSGATGAGISYALTGTLNTWQPAPIAAAAYGIAVRLVGDGNTPWSGPNPPSGIFVPVSSAYVQDEPSPASIALTGVIGNAGAVMSIGTRWMLLGAPTSFPVLVDNNTNHKQGVWGQPMTLLGTAGPIFPPDYFFVRPSPGAGLSQFLPADAIAALSASGVNPPYGMLGFRPPPPA